MDSTEKFLLFFPVCVFAATAATVYGLVTLKELTNPYEEPASLTHGLDAGQVLAAPHERNEQLSEAFTDALNATVDAGAPFRVEVYDSRLAPSPPPAPDGMN
jgi:hypothetical protein